MVIGGLVSMENFTGRKQKHRFFSENVLGWPRFLEMAILMFRSGQRSFLGTILSHGHIKHHKTSPLDIS
jgi:hypothetical protein